MGRYRTKEYLRFDLFDGDILSPGEYRNVIIRMIKTRKPHICHLSRCNGEQHMIKAGDYARLETAIFEEKWVSYYCCIACLDRELDIETETLEEEE